MSTDSQLVLWSTQDGATTLTMNNPRKLNGWTEGMLAALQNSLSRAATDPETAVVILTGADPYYCAGVNLSAVVSPDHPAKLHAFIAEKNEELFEMFLSFPKPILVAVNGPAIGASVTSATLCDAIIASENATFSTPFAKLGVTPEGCSSVMFPKLLGEETADRILGAEGFRPTGAEAVDIGLADYVVPHDELLERAHEIAREWIVSGRERSFKGGYTVDDLREVNRRESQDLAYAFLGPDFLRGQYAFLKSKGKLGPALVFRTLLLTRPLWGRFLP